MSPVIVGRISTAENCRTYWGSHGCGWERGHSGPCICWDCYDPEDTEGYVGRPPYYGPETQFYGEDARLSNPAGPFVELDSPMSSEESLAYDDLEWDESRLVLEQEDAAPPSKNPGLA